MLLARFLHANPISIFTSSGLAVQAVPKVSGEPASHTISILFNAADDMFHRFNQTTIAYDATKEEKVKALGEKRAQVEQRLKE